MRLNIPDGVKLIGANLVPNPNISYTANRRFEGLWSSEWDWTGWVKPQIDYLLGDCGCNCIRSIGGHWGISAGRIDAATYKARQMQVAEYLHSKGAYYYPCGDSIRVDADNTTTADVHAGLMSDYLLALQGVGNVIGFDLINEANGNAYFSVATLRSMIAGIKARGVSLPLTISTAETLTGSGATWINSIYDAFDFLDCHVYTFPHAATYHDYFLLNSDKDIIVGEVGTNTTALTATGGGTEVEQLGNIGPVYSLALGGHPRLRGVLMWACADLETAQSGEWGVYDTNSTPGTFKARSHKVNLLRRKTRGSTALSKTI